MARAYREVRQTVMRDDPEVEVTDTYAADRGVSIAERIIYLIGGIIMAVLALRFILSLLGANRGNAFASFIYGLSYPFVAPFFGLFNYTPQFGVVRFEFETLIAILFWGLVTWGLARLVTIGRRRVV